VQLFIGTRSELAENRDWHLSGMNYRKVLARAIDEVRNSREKGLEREQDYKAARKVLQG